jgi:3-hydroxyisobutyrate dehydrogenase-like beta-hydroxyacid dehydrogenase
VLNQDWSPGFAITHQRKDFGYVKEYASKIDANVPGSELVDDLLRPLEEEGHGQWTTAALYEVLRKGHTP